jgi:NitT/TauT family transport system permease protein
MKVAIGLCLVGVIIGEFLAAKSGLGYLIVYSSQIFAMDTIAMAIIILCILSIVLFKIVDLVEMLYKRMI